MKMNILAGIGTCATLALAAALAASSAPRAQSGTPRYEFDASWNKPFPNRWINGGLGGVIGGAHFDFDGLELLARLGIKLAAGFERSSQVRPRRPIAQRQTDIDAHVPDAK